MDTVSASRLWRDAFETTLGVDSSGNEITERTRFGSAACALGLSPWPLTGQGRDDVVSFLRSWADSLDGKGEVEALRARIAELERTLAWHTSAEYQIHLDGDQYCATGRGFKGLQESEVAFASGPVVALAKLMAVEERARRMEGDGS